MSYISEGKIFVFLKNSDGVGDACDKILVPMPVGNFMPPLPNLVPVPEIKPIKKSDEEISETEQNAPIPNKGQRKK
ncbi:MAG: hypothetical protein KC505_03295 [Myxococcales bacterium]|nr:hypothetical protein [Myxococcales bacterium]USN49794.1 MAG: hypothetical protein H6731_05795 [Myxococcales bacterium]